MFNANMQKVARKQEVMARLVASPVLKAVGMTAFMTSFFWLYFQLLHKPMHPVQEMPLTGVDYWIGFSPWALGLYLSLWVYVSLPIALLRHLPDMICHGVHAAGLCLFGLLIFLLWPTAVPQGDPAWTRTGIDWLQSIDAAGNACPSLHVATAVYAAVWLNLILREVDMPDWLRWVNGLWCVGIVYSTLAIRQHVFLDVLAGAALGAVFAWLSLHHRRRWGCAPEPSQHGVANAVDSP